MASVEWHVVLSLLEADGPGEWYVEVFDTWEFIQSYIALVFRDLVQLEINESTNQLYIGSSLFTESRKIVNQSIRQNTGKLQGIEASKQYSE